MIRLDSVPLSFFPCFFGKSEIHRNILYLIPTNNAQLSLFKRQRRMRTNQNLSSLPSLLPLTIPLSVASVDSAFSLPWTKEGRALLQFSQRIPERSLGSKQLVISSPSISFQRFYDLFFSPIQVELFRYQIDLCKKAMKENVIVYLGTGCGKTHIAVLLMYELGHLIRKPSKEVCVFLAPNVPLVRQVQAFTTHFCF